jgi:hypothetical protein
MIRLSIVVFAVVGISALPAAAFQSPGAIEVAAPDSANLPTRVSTEHVRTTGDLLRFGAAFKVTCRDCGSAKTFSAKAAVMAFGNVPVWHTEERLKCSRCRKRSAKVEVLSPV